MTLVASQSTPLLTPGEVAVLFHVDPKTVTRWANTGRLGCIRTLGGHRRFREPEVMELLQIRSPNDEPTADDVISIALQEITDDKARLTLELARDEAQILRVRRRRDRNPHCTVEEFFPAPPQSA